MIPYRICRTALTAMAVASISIERACSLLRPGDPYSDPEFVPAALRVQGEGTLLAMQPAVATDPSFLG